MHTILRYPDGTRVYALLLSHEDARLRMMVPGTSDTLELRKAPERWEDENGTRISIEALVCAERGLSLAAAVDPAPTGSFARARSRCRASG